MQINSALPLGQEWQIIMNVLTHDGHTMSVDENCVHVPDPKFTDLYNLDGDTYISHIMKYCWYIP